MILNNNHYDNLKKESEKFNYEFVHIDGGKCITIDELFTEFFLKFKFPDYFGYNWPAFDECINDLNWLPADGYVVLISNVAKILPNNNQDFETFIKIFINTINEWVIGRNFDGFPTPPTPFYLFLECDKESETKINKILAKHKI